MVKMRFPVMSSAVRFNYKFQVDLAVALCTLHNFIRMHGCRGDRFEDEADAAQGQAGPDEERDDEVVGDNSDEAKAWRDEIATAMWVQYQSVLQSR